jgi:F0F1-type ATP synthase beta subunit
MKEYAMIRSEKHTVKYVLQINNRTIKRDKEMVDEYSEIVCPVDEQILIHTINILGKKENDDSVPRATSLYLSQKKRI